MTKILDWYEYRGITICQNYGGCVFEGDWYVYKTLIDVKNAIDKTNDSSNKAEPRVLRKMNRDEYIHFFK